MRINCTLCVVGLAALAVTDCEDDGGSSGGPRAQEGPLYLIATTVFGPDSDTTYLVTASSLEAGVEPDYERAIAFDSFASLYGVNGQRDVYVGSGESPEITKWTVAEDGSLKQGPTLSFANLGLATAGGYPEYVKFVSPTKAYLLDTSQMRLLTWNPAEMTLIGEIDLGVAPRNGIPPFGGDALVLRDDGTLFAGVLWFDYDEQLGAGAVVVVEVDTKTDRVVAQHEDTRCGDNYSTSVASDGTTYFSGGAWPMITRQKLGEPYGAIPCMLRVLPGSGGWDPSYFVDLTTLTGGRPTGELMVVTDGVGFVRAFHEEDAAPFDGDILSYLDEPAFRWWRWNLGEATATVVPDQQPSVAGGLRYRIDGRTFVTNSSADYSTTTLTELSADRGIVPGITVRGYPYGVVRVR